MNLRKRYLTYMVLALVPQLHGCLWDSIHVDGTLDASNESKAEETLPKGEESLKSEDTIDEDTI